MIEVNKPIDTTPNALCYICKSEFYVHPDSNMNSNFITDCRLQRAACVHEWAPFEIKPSNSMGQAPTAFKNVKCKKCGKFYR